MSVGDSAPCASLSPASGAQKGKVFPIMAHQSQRPDPFANDPVADPSSWPTDSATGPLPGPTQSMPQPSRYGYDHQPRQENWREAQDDRAQQREQARERRRDLERETFRLQQRLRQLDAEEAVISAQLAALPQPALWLARLIIALVVVAALIAALAVYPALVVPVIGVLLVVARMNRRRKWHSRQRHGWAGQERFRLESRWSGMVAERTALSAQLAAMQAQLTSLSQP